MQITSLSSAFFQPAGGTQAISKMRQSFKELGSALESGDLSSAKDVLAQMKKNAPARGGGDNPMSQKMDALSKAVESGDVKAAQQAYADIKKTMAQAPGAGGAMAGSRGAAGGRTASGWSVPRWRTEAIRCQRQQCEFKQDLRQEGRQPGRHGLHDGGDSVQPEESGAITGGFDQRLTRYHSLIVHRRGSCHRVWAMSWSSANPPAEDAGGILVCRIRGLSADHLWPEQRIS